MMHRLEFVQIAGGGLATARLGEAIAASQVARNPQRRGAKIAAKSKHALMKVGTQHGDSNEILRVLAAFGVNHICSRWPRNTK